MIRLNILALAGAVLATSFSVIAVSPAAATAHEQVRYGDVDLGAPSGRATLDRRVARAATRACLAADERQLAMVGACRRTAIADANTTLKHAAVHGSVAVALR